jgi:8-oxo-dGTP pyrophosphatase MutT (NUDIX family)
MGSSNLRFLSQSITKVLYQLPLLVNGGFRRIDLPKCFASAVVLKDEDRLVLLHKREDFRIWGLPGGNLDKGEAPEHGAIRETYEETGYHIEIDGFVVEFHRSQLKDVRYVYRGHIIGGKPIKIGPETLAVEWFPVHDLPRKLAPSVKEIIAVSIREVQKPVKRLKIYHGWQIALFRGLIWLRNLRNEILKRQ